MVVESQTGRWMESSWRAAALRVAMLPEGAQTGRMPELLGTDRLQESGAAQTDPVQAGPHSQEAPRMERSPGWRVAESV
ncbi:MAG: hypothetical protein Rubg2KO_37900 [Rubricoccaceae bacterium]